jgi:hypothetical protein
MILQALRAKIARHHYAPLQRLFLDTDEQDRGVGETPSLYHVLRQKKRREFLMVNEIRGMEGNLQTSPRVMVLTFKDFMTTKYTTITIDNDSIGRIVRDAGQTFSQ